MKHLALIIMLIPGVVFAQFTSLSDSLTMSRELSGCEILGCIPNGWPCDGYVTSGFGYRVHPIFGKWSYHNGVDIANKKGTPIHATGAGVVIYCGSGRGYTGYGNIVIIKHSDHVTTRYAHLDTMSVEIGDEVQRGDEIGVMGRTGWSTGPHLHYEIRVDGVPVDPEDWM